MRLRIPLILASVSKLVNAGFRRPAPDEIHTFAIRNPYVAKTLIGPGKSSVLRHLRRRAAPVPYLWLIRVKTASSPSSQAVSAP